MLSFIQNLLARIKTPWIRYAVEVGAVVILLIVFFTLLNQVQSCGYQRGSEKYHEAERAWATERAGILARAEASEKRAAELEPKAIAFEALAAQHKAADAGLVKKIEEVSQNAANEEAKAEGPADCVVRAARVCDLLRANRISADCGAITRESCGPR